MDEIKSMRVRGANEIAIAGLKALKEIAKKNGFGKEFNRACNLLVKTRPTAVVLYNSIEKIKKEKTVDNIDKLIYYLENVSEMIGFVNWKLIKNNSMILTHCHSTDVINFLRVAHENGRKFSVVVTETRPLLQGLKTAKELSEIGVPITYVIDSAVGYFMPKVDLVVVGADSVREDSLINKIGTYPIAVLAKMHKKPFYVVANKLKIDRRKKVVIEERNPDEIIKMGVKGVKISNPAFDSTPLEYVKGVVCEKGLLKPREFLRLMR